MNLRPDNLSCFGSTIGNHSGVKYGEIIPERSVNNCLYLSPFAIDFCSQKATSPPPKALSSDRDGCRQVIHAFNLCVYI